MSAIDGGMYSGKTPITKMISLDPRTKKIFVANEQTITDSQGVEISIAGEYVEVPSLDYVRDLEKQILELKRAIGIMNREDAKHDLQIKRLNTATKKLEQKLV